MKKLYILIFLVLLYNNSFSQNTTEWSWIHPRPQGQYLNWVKMFDANNWIAVGDYGTFIKTTNGGLNWTTKSYGFVSATYPNAPIYQTNKTAYFFDMMTGFIGPQSARGVIKTTNGGLTFDTIQIIPNGFGTVYQIYFINQNTGYLATNSAMNYLRRTINGGMNWSPITVPTTSNINCVYASDTSNLKYGTSSGNVYLSSDAGSNWVASNVGTTNTIYGMNFLNNNTGYICGAGGLVRYTTNGGANWTGSSLPSTSSYYSIMISGNDVYVAGTSSTQDMWKSTDNGNTWTSISYTVGPSITNFNAYSTDKIGNTFVMVGTYGEIIYSTDAGVHWTSAMYRKSLATMVDLYAKSGDGKVIALGTLGSTPSLMLVSNDGGINWNTGSYTTTNNMSNICMLNENTGFASGRYGQFIKTTDGGITWDTSKSNISIMTPYFCNGLSFINEQTGWITGGTPGITGNTKIWKTTDGGSNWTEQISSYSGPIGIRIKMYNANIGYINHSAGFQKTTNGGDNWILCATPGTSGTSYTPISMIDSITFFTSGSNSQVYSTTDGGTSWDSLNFPVKAGTLFGCDFINYNTGIVGGVFGCVGKTTNHGQTWQINTTGGYTTYAVDMVSADTAFAVCGNTAGAQIFKYIKSTPTSGFTYENQIPKDYFLKQNYPNPFNPVTTIEFNIPKQSNVSIKIFDMLGREYKTEITGMNLGAGNYKMNFNAMELTSGIYFYSLIVDGKNISTKRMAVIK